MTLKSQKRSRKILMIRMNHCNCVAGCAFVGAKMPIDGYALLDHTRRCSLQTWRKSILVLIYNFKLWTSDKIFFYNINNRQ